jgi:hypothetical protein
MATNEVLIQLGEFRLVRHSDPFGDGVIQHHCNNKRGTHLGFSDPENGWWYCWESERKCAGCHTSTPDEIVGLHMIHNWER